MPIPTTHTIISRTDTSEYLSRFEFFLPEMPTWSKDINESFCFRSHSDAESNARLILDRLDDPLNRRVGLKIAGAEMKKGKLVVGDWYSICIVRVA
jgi:hypothetical protein